MGDVLGEIIYDELNSDRVQCLPKAAGGTLDASQAAGILNQMEPGFKTVGTGSADWQNRADYLVSRLANMLRDNAYTAALPAHNKPHYWSFPIDLSTRINVGGAAFAAGVWATAITYVVPAGCQARIESYGVNVGNDPGGNVYTWNGSLVWRIQVNGVSKYADLDGWTIQRGSIVLPRKTVMNLQEDTQLTFQYRRAVNWPALPAAPLAQDVDFCFVGYTWRPRQQLDGSRASIVYTG